ncbi:7-carboxy-7-deazaguanine synthase QueE [Amycolatopsis sp. NPDC059657]|uniref:7-carboxy-7-deazaguanine synthase QueE n=1 Tax=Amycolatopsis sp. NPDC059657 TaxID=3346899 RepID=UPI00366E5609
MQDAEHGIVINELFGPTFQGEGPSIGRYARFIRLFGCHLSCTWCDSAQTHDGDRYNLTAEQRIVEIEHIVGWLASEEPGVVVVTGGEPLLQQRSVERLVRGIRDRQAATEIELETSGTIAPSTGIITAVSRFNVSPKLAHSGLRRHRRIRPTAIESLSASGKAVWKFVAASVDDLDEIDELATAYELAPIWVMPEGTDSETVLARMRQLSEPVLARGWNLSTRLHILLWENTRAR